MTLQSNIWRLCFKMFKAAESEDTRDTACIVDLKVSVSIAPKPDLPRTFCFIYTLLDFLVITP